MTRGCVHTIQILIKISFWKWLYDLLGTDVGCSWLISTLSPCLVYDLGLRSFCMLVTAICQQMIKNGPLAQFKFLAHKFFFEYTPREGKRGAAPVVPVAGVDGQRWRCGLCPCSGRRFWPCRLARPLRPRRAASSMACAETNQWNRHELLQPMKLI